MKETCTEERLYDRLREEAIRRFRSPHFVHHEWYVPYHLLLVERVTKELLDLHPEADRILTYTLVWLHDIGKTADTSDTQDVHAETRVLGRDLLLSIGFDPSFQQRVDEYLGLIDAKRNLADAPIEAQIVSSADGCSHLLGPFMAIWWRDNPTCSVDELMSENRQKARTAWNEKIVLPEARKSFEARYRSVLEQSGEIPAQLITDFLD